MKKHKAMRQGTPIRWDAVDFVKKHKPENKTAVKSSAEEARERMIERHKQIFSENPFTEVKQPVSYEDAYNHMTRDRGADDARNRMIERRRNNAK